MSMIFNLGAHAGCVYARPRVILPSQEGDPQ
jgi:hypothetical protein